MKKFFFTFAWLLLTAGIILTTTASVGLSRSKKQAEKELVEPEQPKTLAQTEDINPDYTDIKGVQTVIETQDARATIVANFLKRYNSPLKPYDHYGKVFVDIADRHNFDFRLLPSIAMQESNLCKSIPENSFNCLGFGIHERGTLAFENFEANFERAGRELKKYYIDQGRTTPEEIEKKYTPFSGGHWASSVNQWMAEMRYDDRESGRKLKTNASVLEFANEASDGAKALE